MGFMLNEAIIWEISCLPISLIRPFLPNWKPSLISRKNPRMGEIVAAGSKLFSKN